MTITEEEKDFQPLPRWLNIDGLVPPAERARIEHCAAAAHKVLDAVLAFSDEWGEYCEMMFNAPFVADFSGEIKRTLCLDLGLNVVQGPLNLAEGALAILDGDSPRHGVNGFLRLTEAATHPHQEASLRALFDRAEFRDPKFDLALQLLAEHEAREANDD